MEIYLIIIGLVLLTVTLIGVIFSETFRVILILLACAGIIGVVCSFFKLPEWVMGPIYTCILVTVGIISALRGGKCPKCNHARAMKSYDKELVNTASTTMDVEQTISDKLGRYAGSYTQTIPAAVYTYKLVKKCKYCGYETYEIKKETKRG